MHVARAGSGAGAGRAGERAALGSGGWGGLSRVAAAAEAAAVTGDATRGETSDGSNSGSNSGTPEGGSASATGSGSRTGGGSGSLPGSGGITSVSSDSKCQGWRSTSNSSCSLRSAPTAGRSSESMDGSKTSSWASQSFSSSRQVGGATNCSSPLLRSSTAGTCPVGASFQCGSSGCSSTTGPVTSRTVSPAGSAPMMRTRPEW